MTNFLSNLLAFTFLLGTGCGGADVEDGSEDGEAPAVAPEFEGGGQEAVPEIAYPAGPFGINRKSVVRNYEFLGFIDPSAEGGRDGFLPVSLSDFYNPTGKELFPEGSPYGAGNPKPKALGIVVSARWCGPCQQEARDVLPGKYAALKPKGAEFLLNLAQDLQGEPAKLSDLRTWTKTYKVNYPSVLDPAQKLSSLFEASAFPANLIIRTKDMSIVESVSGVPNETYWANFEEVLDESPTDSSASAAE